MQNYYSYPLAKIGILGGGQLGKMMAQEAKKMGFYVATLDPNADCPAKSVSDKHITGSLYDKDKISELVKECDITTYEIEHIDTQVLKELVKKGAKIYPSPDLLSIIQDKLKQKEALHRAGIPIPKFNQIIDISELKSFDFPIVQKARYGGYDGRGVMILKSKDDLKNAIKNDFYVEEYIDIKKELAVIVARSVNGETKCYQVVEMIFDQKANICDMVIAPADIKEDISEQAKAIAKKAVEALGGIGVFGIELFLTQDNKVLLNEIAPRPHNSGHYTIEACPTSQFEQHIRAIMGLPLGSTDLLSPAVMVNLLGEEGYEGPPIIEGLKKALSIQGLSFHFYGKSQTRPYRKMGHITIIDSDINQAVKKAKKAKDILKIKSKEVK